MSWPRLYQLLKVISPMQACTPQTLSILSLPVSYVEDGAGNRDGSRTARALWPLCSIVSSCEHVLPQMFLSEVDKTQAATSARLERIRHDSCVNCVRSPLSNVRSRLQLTPCERSACAVRM